MTNIPLDAAGLVNLVAIVLAFLFGLIPPLKNWFDTLGEWRATVMAVVMLLVAAGWLLNFCQLAVVCLQANALAVLLIWVEAFLVNQGLYHKAVKPLQLKFGI